MKPIARHGVVELADVMATHCGHIFNIKADKDYDNGCAVALGAIDATDYEVYAAKPATNADEIMLIASVPTVVDARTQSEKNECYFYNKEGDIMRCHQLVPHDRFAVSGSLIKAANGGRLNGEFVVGNKIVVEDEQGGKYKETSSPVSEAFVAQIERVVTKGYGNGADKRVYLRVLKNSAAK